MCLNCFSWFARLVQGIKALSDVDMRLLSFVLNAKSIPVRQRSKIIPQTYKPNQVVYNLILKQLISSSNQWVDFFVSLLAENGS